MTILWIAIIALVLTAIFVLIRMPSWRRLAMREEMNQLGLSSEEISKAERGVKTGNTSDLLATLTAAQERQRESIKQLTGIDLRTYIPTIGEEISWNDVYLQVFRVLEFDRAGTTTGPDGSVNSNSMFTPYGYLLVMSPIFNQSVRLPIVHRDDFLLADSVFADPTLAAAVESEELLVTYAPRKLLSDGRSGDPAHVLHYLLTGFGTLEDYYSQNNDSHMAKPNPSLLFGKFDYEGEIRVNVASL